MSLLNLNLSSIFPPFKSVTKSRVSIVGAGPGDKDLITVKGLKAIQSADVILYDALVNVELLKKAKKGAQLIFVGKRAGVKSKKQEEINYLIVKSALQYGHAVRLKGGDPFIFGRGHEELEHVRAFNIEVEVIPGISSSTSLPLLQQVPVTCRGVSESFWVLTGTTRLHQLSKDIALAAQSSATLVILMAIRKLPLIREILLEEGKHDLPIMIIEKGSTPDERVLISTIDKVLQDVKEQKISTPGILVIGEVVRLHPEFIKTKATAVALKNNNNEFTK